MHDTVQSLLPLTKYFLYYISRWQTRPRRSRRTRKLWQTSAPSARRTAKNSKSLTPQPYPLLLFNPFTYSFIFVDLVLFSTLFCTLFFLTFRLLPSQFILKQKKWRQPTTATEMATFHQRYIHLIMSTRHLALGFFSPVYNGHEATAVLCVYVCDLCGGHFLPFFSFSSTLHVFRRKRLLFYSATRSHEINEKKRNIIATWKLGGERPLLIWAEYYFPDNSIRAKTHVFPLFFCKSMGDQFFLFFCVCFFVYCSSRRSRMGVLLGCMTRLLGYFLSAVFFFVITGKALRQVASLLSLLSLPLSPYFPFHWFLSFVTSTSYRLNDNVLCRRLLAVFFLLSALCDRTIVKIDDVANGLTTNVTICFFAIIFSIDSKSSTIAFVVLANVHFVCALRLLQSRTMRSVINIWQ